MRNVISLLARARSRQPVHMVRAARAPRARTRLPMLIMALILPALMVPAAAAAPSRAPVPGNRQVTIDQKDNLVNQVVRVRWSGFKPSSDPTLTDSTKYVVRVYQCRGKNPAGPADCYGSEKYTYLGKVNGATVLPDGPTNAVTTVTDSKGNGVADIEVRTQRESPSLDCQKFGCSLVVVPNDGDPTQPGTDGQLATQGYMDSPWAWWIKDDTAPGGKRSNHITIPLNFAPTSATCALGNPDATISGSPGARRLVEQWEPATCRLAKPVDVDFTALGEPQARASFASKSSDMAFVTRPDDTVPTRPYTYAPIGLSGIAIAYRIDDGDTGLPITDLKLTPRLVAKLLTESYGMNATCDPGGGPKQDCNRAVDGNPQDIFHDKEFVSLNGHRSWPSMGWPTLVSGQNDLAHELTRWLAADPDTKNFLAGKSGPGGHVNKNFKGIAYPADSFEGRDPDPRFIHGFIPVLGLSEVARFLVTNRDNSENYEKDPATGNYLKTPPYPVGNRGLFAIVSTSDAAALRFPVAKVRNAAGKFVGPTDAGMLAALRAMPTNKDKITQAADYSAKGADVYPLTMAHYAMVPTNGVDATKAEKIGRFLDYAAGPGQAPGVQPGQLPAGYVPLPAALRAQTKKAAAEVRAQKGVLPAQPPSASPTTSTTPTGATTTPNPSLPLSSTAKNPGANAPVSLPLIAGGGNAPLGGRLSADVSGLVHWLLPALFAFGILAVMSGLILYTMGLVVEPGQGLHRTGGSAPRPLRRRPPGGSS